MQLREATRDAHERLEAAMALDPARLTMSRYTRAVQVLHAVRAGWEPGLASLLPNYQGAHLDWLTADLAALCARPIGPAAPLPLASAAEAWGARYVLEGSALGGRVLLPAAAGLGLTATAGARYFAGAGADTGRRWTVFLAQLETVGATANTADLIEGARTAFRALEQLAESTMATIRTDQPELVYQAI